MQLCGAVQGDHEASRTAASTSSMGSVRVWVSALRTASFGFSRSEECHEGLDSLSHPDLKVPSFSSFNHCVSNGFVVS